MFSNIHLIILQFEMNLVIIYDSRLHDLINWAGTKKSTNFFLQNNLLYILFILPH